jgi:copper chaperone CopZ
MKKFLFALLFIVPVAHVFEVQVHAMEVKGNPIVDAITKALNSGDAETLSQYFGAKVQISIGDQEQTLEKSKAKETLKTFFQAKRSSGYAAMHSGKSKENNDQYMIGNLSTDSGTYRVYIYLKTAGTTLTIQEIRFDQ